MDYPDTQSSWERFLLALAAATFCLIACAGLTRTLPTSVAIDLRWLGLATLVGAGLSALVFFYRFDRLR
jgi:uncharacterized membrane-anchored protein